MTLFHFWYIFFHLLRLLLFSIHVRLLFSTVVFMRYEWPPRKNAKVTRIEPGSLIFYSALFVITPPRYDIGVLRSVCLCVCLSVRQRISGTAGPTFTKFFVLISCGRGSALLWWRCDMLCTSGLTDDLRFGSSGPYGGRCDTGAESDVYECLVYHRVCLSEWVSVLFVQILKNLIQKLGF